MSVSWAPPGLTTVALPAPADMEEKYSGVLIFLAATWGIPLSSF